MPMKSKSPTTTRRVRIQPLVSRRLPTDFPPTHPGEMLLEEFLTRQRVSPVWECTGARLCAPTVDSGYTRRRVSMGALCNTGRVAMSPKAVTPRPPPAMP
jgi:hypothetical protein